MIGSELVHRCWVDLVANVYACLYWVAVLVVDLTLRAQTQPSTGYGFKMPDQLHECFLVYKLLPRTSIRSAFTILFACGRSTTHRSREHLLHWRFPALRSSTGRPTRSAARATAWLERFRTRIRSRRQNLLWDVYPSSTRKPDGACRDNNGTSRNLRRVVCRWRQKDKGHRTIEQSKMRG